MLFQLQLKTRQQATWVQDAIPNSLRLKNSVLFESESKEDAIMTARSYCPFDYVLVEVIEFGEAPPRLHLKRD